MLLQMIKHKEIQKRYKFSNVKEISQCKPRTERNMARHKAIPNKLVDSHPIFEKNWGGGGFYFLLSPTYWKAGNRQAF